MARPRWGGGRHERCTLRAVRSPLPLPGQRRGTGSPRVLLSGRLCPASRSTRGCTPGPLDRSPRCWSGSGPLWPRQLNLPSEGERSSAIGRGRIRISLPLGDAHADGPGPRPLPRGDPRIGPTAASRSSGAPATVRARTPRRHPERRYRRCPTSRANREPRLRLRCRARPRALRSRTAPRRTCPIDRPALFLGAAVQIRTPGAATSM